VPNLKQALQPGGRVGVDDALAAHAIQQARHALQPRGEILGRARRLGHGLTEIAHRMPDLASPRHVVLTPDLVGLHPLLGGLVMGHRKPSFDAPLARVARMSMPRRGLPPGRAMAR
jgi:hypothetical protein